MRTSSIATGFAALFLVPAGMSAAHAEEIAADSAGNLDSGTQDDAGERPNPSAPGEARSDDTVIYVTAQKREERLLDVPIAVTAVTGEQIEDRGYSNLSDLLQLAPGVSVTGSLIQVRGISSIFGAATVGYYLDELPFSFLISAQLPDVRAWDLERVEVLRGPQGTLYGANSIGGTIRVLTRNPDLDDFEAKGEAGIGFMEDGGGTYLLRGAVNAPLIQDRLAVRLAATYDRSDGFVDSPLGRDIDDNNIVTLRGKMAIAPLDNLRITLSAWSYDAERDNSTAARPNRLSTNPFPNPTDLEYQVYGGIVQFEGRGFDVVSSSSFIDLDLDSRATAFLAGGPVVQSAVTEAQTFSQELRLVSTDDRPFRWTVGGFYQDSEETQISNIPGVIAGNARGTSESWAVFGEGTYRFGGDFEATVGARYFEDRRRNEESLATLPPIPSVEGDYSTFNPKFNLAWHASGNSLWYATVAKGFRSGQNQPASSLFIAGLFGLSVPSQIDPETLWSYEVGNKTSLLDGRLVIETALYYNDWKDLQVTVTAGGIIGALVNAGDAHAFGADLAILFRPVDGLTLAMSGNINESQLDSTVPTAFTEGDRITNVPKYTLSTSATYERPIGRGLNLYGFAELQQGGRRVLNAQGFTGESDPQSIVNLRVGVEGENWGAYLTGQNLLDESGYLSPALSSTDFNAPIPQPRTLGLLVRGNF